MNKNNDITATVEEISEFMTLWKTATPEAQAAARAMLEQTAPAADDSADLDDADEYRGFILQAFDHATDEMLNEDTKTEARQLVKMYFGAENPADASPAMCLMTGLIMGVNEGMRIAETLDSIAAEQQQNAAQ